MSGKGFRYQDRNDSDYENRANQSLGDFESFIRSEYKLYKPHTGDNYVRFLPPTFEDPKHYGIDVWVHYGIGPSEASVICLQKMKREPCPCCEARIVADRRGDSTLADDLKPNRRVLVWLLDMKEAQRDRRPLLWAMGGATDLDFTKQTKDRDTGTWRRVDHPDDGLNVSFDRTGEKQRTRYSGIQFSSKPSSVPDEDLDYIMDHPLPEVLRWRTYEEVAELFDGSVRRGGTSARDTGRDRPDDRGRDRDRPDDRGRPRDEEPSRRGRSDDRDPPRDTGRDRDRPDDRDRGTDRPRGDDRPGDRSDSRERPRGDDRSSERDPPPDDRNTRRPRGDDREPPPRDEDRPRSAQATSDELRRRWNTDAPRDAPGDRKREGDRDAGAESGRAGDSDAPRRTQRD